MHNLAWWNALSPEWQQVFFDNINIPLSSPQFFTSIDALLELRIYSKTRTNITNLTPISGLKNLKKIDCENNQISDLTGIPTNITYLNCCGNKIADLSPLANLRHLEYLLAARNEISDLSPLSKLRKLKSLHCNGNPIKTYEPLKCLKDSLESLTCTLREGLTNNLHGVWLDKKTKIFPK